MKWLRNERTIHILIPVISAILGLLAGAIIMVLGGYDAVKGMILYLTVCWVVQKL